MLARASANSILLGNEMLKGLPTSWVNDFVTLHTIDTGWTYRQTGQPYCFWEYHGRWKLPR
jgi:hypothetical protein